MITAVIITFNEEEKIADCIQSISTVCSECIVIDAESTDQTKQIAQQLGAKVYSKKWEGYGAARNYGASLAPNPWILCIDADERIDERLSRSIPSITLETNKIYKFNRLTQYCGKWIKHGTWHPEWKSKLYHRRFYQWDDRPVHEELTPIQGTKMYQQIQGLLLHAAYSSHADLEMKLDQYARLYRAERADQPISLIKKLCSPKYHFLRSYIWKMGFMDGRAGYNIARAIEGYHRKKLN